MSEELSKAGKDGGQPDDMNKGKMPPWLEGKDKDGKDKEDMKNKDKDDDKTEKSVDQGGVTEERLQKSLDSLENLAAESPAARKDVLLAKAQSDEGLTAEENIELYKALGGEVEEQGLAEEVSKSLDPEQNEDLGATIDVTGYLGELNKSMQTFCFELADRVEKSQNRQDVLSLELCKGVASVGRAVLEQGKLIKSVQEQVASFGRTPARGPKAQLGPEAVQKSFAGSAPAGEELSKAEIGDSLSAMLKASVDGGKQGFSACGEDLGIAGAKFENGSQISPALYQEMIQFRRANGMH